MRKMCECTKICKKKKKYHWLLTGIFVFISIAVFCLFAQLHHFSSSNIVPVDGDVLGCIITSKVNVFKQSTHRKWTRQHIMAGNSVIELKLYQETWLNQVSPALSTTETSVVLNTASRTDVQFSFRTNLLLGTPRTPAWNGVDFFPSFLKWRFMQ